MIARCHESATIFAALSKGRTVMSFCRLLVAAALLIGLAGCGTSPTQPPVVGTPLSLLTVVPAGDTLLVGQTRAFTVIAVDTDSVVVPNPVVGWGSTNTTVFTVSSGGVVTAQGEGTAMLIASSGGLRDTATLMVLPTQRGWFQQTGNVSSYPLNGVFFQPDGNSGWAVGGNGRIVFTSNAGGTWTQQTSNVSNALNSVWFTSATEGWIAGDGGRILHTTNAGATWGVISSGTIEHLNGIVFATPDTGWAVGPNGTILRTFDRGASWSILHPTTFTLRGVSFAGTRDGWAVGDNGVIVGTHDRGLTWFVVQPSVTSSALHGVWRSSLAATNAVGDVGAVPRTTVTPDSVAWENRTIGAVNNLKGVHFIDATTGWAVGKNASATAVIVTTTDGGTAWSAPQSVPSGFGLNAVWFVDGMRGWAVGDNGSIVHTVTGGAP
jgi:photosystem II stability/assembly factor-like uncharacterized protein